MRSTFRCEDRLNAKNAEYTAEIEKEPEIVNTLVLETLQKLGPYLYNPEYEN
jgi:hypothetical protein